MPQMSPLLWLNLLIFFLMVFMLLNCELYYFLIFSKYKFVKISNLEKKSNNLKW